MSGLKASAGSNDNGLPICEGWGPSDHDDADLKIVSSDNTCLWVSSKQLSHHSPVFSSMISTCNDSSARVNLTDLDIENAFNLSAVFETIAALEMSNQQNVDLALDTFLTVEVWLFATKYGMQSIMTAIRTNLFDLATQYPATGGVHFLVAAHMAEWALCGRLVASFGTKINRPVAADTRRILKMLDWRGWTPATIASLEKVSKKFAWAVCHAGTKHATFSSPLVLANRIHYEAMGRCLATLMNMTPEEIETETESWDKGYSSWLGL